MTLIKELIPLKASSPQAFLDLLRMHMDIAFSENLCYLEISYRTDKMQKPSSISITSPAIPRDR